MPKATITSNTIGSEIRYTVDGSDVTQESPLYSSQIDIEAGVTVKAKAFKTGMNPSPQSELKSFDKLQTPSVSLSRNEATINITLGNTVSGATYRYKVGSAPTSPTDGTAISGSASLSNSSAVTIYVVGWYTGHYNPSDAGSGSVEQYTPRLQTPTLTLSRSGSTVNGTIGNTVSGATYVYKIGSSPSSQSDGTVISETTFSFSNSNAVTVYVRGFMSGYNPSNAVSRSVSEYVSYPAQGSTLPTPSVSISAVQSGGEWYIRFTVANILAYQEYRNNPNANVGMMFTSYFGESDRGEWEWSQGYKDILWQTLVDSENSKAGGGDIDIEAYDGKDVYLTSNPATFTYEQMNTVMSPQIYPNGKITVSSSVINDSSSSSGISIGFVFRDVQPSSLIVKNLFAIGNIGPQGSYPDAPTLDDYDFKTDGYWVTGGTLDYYVASINKNANRNVWNKLTDGNTHYITYRLCTEQDGYEMSEPFKNWYRN